MTAVTVAVIIAATVFIWLVRPAVGLVVYLVVLCLYPQYLAVSIATVDWTSARALGLVLLLRTVVYPGKTATYRLLWMDLLVLADFTGDFVAHVLTEPFSKVIVREGGQFFDFVVPYFCVRYSIRDRADIFLFFRWIALLAIPLAIVGVYQTVTGVNPYAFMRQYSPWGIGDQEIDVRRGFYRADGPFANKIAFGLYFAMAMAMHIGGFFSQRIRPHVWLTHAAMIFAGLMSSMSSAPLFALVTTVAWVAVRPLRKYIPYVFFAFFLCILVVELYSDRHFYHVLTRFALQESTAYYRIQLIEEALGGGMDGHWLAGYGYVGVGPGTDNSNFHWVHKDFVNIYIGRLATGGLLGLVPFMVLNVYYYYCLYRATKLSRSFETSWMLWCLSAGVIGWNVAMMTVGALEQVNMLLGMILGVIAIWLSLLARNEADEPGAHDTAPAPSATHLARSHSSSKTRLNRIR